MWAALGHDGLVGFDGVLTAHLLGVDAGHALQVEGVQALRALLDDRLVTLGSVVERISGRVRVKALPPVKFAWPQNLLNELKQPPNSAWSLRMLHVQGTSGGLLRSSQPTSALLRKYA